MKIDAKADLIQPGLRTIRGYCHLPAMHHALQVEMNSLSNREENWRSATMGAQSIPHKIKWRYHFIIHIYRKQLFNPGIIERHFQETKTIIVNDFVSPSLSPPMQ